MVYTLDLTYSNISASLPTYSPTATNTLITSEYRVWPDYASISVSITENLTRCLHFPRRKGNTLNGISDPSIVWLR